MATTQGQRERGRRDQTDRARSFTARRDLAAHAAAHFPAARNVGPALLAAAPAFAAGTTSVAAASSATAVTTNAPLAARAPRSVARGRSAISAAPWLAI